MDLLVLHFCLKCKGPDNFQSSGTYPGWVHGSESCFGCGKVFNGNTSARTYTIDLSGDNVDYKNQKI